MVRSSMDSFLLFSFKPSQFKEPKHAPCRKLSSFVYSRAHGSTSCPTNKISHPTHSSISSSLFLPILLPPTKVGDNPASDMAMAAFGGPRWRGVLVCSGVYSETDATCGGACGSERQWGGGLHLADCAQGRGGRSGGGGDGLRQCGVQVQRVHLRRDLHMWHPRLKGRAWVRPVQRLRGSKCGCCWCEEFLKRGGR